MNNRIPGTILWVAPFYNRTGYGMGARAWVELLHRAGHRVKIVAVDDVQPGLDDCNLDLIKSLENTPLEPPVTAILSHVPQQAWLDLNLPQPSIRLVTTTFDGDRPPAEWVNVCNQLDQVWLITQFDRRSWTANGLNPALVHTMKFPHPWLDNPALPEPVFAPHSAERPFRFLNISIFLPRRRWDALIEAYLTEFSHGEPVELVLRVSYPSWHPQPGKPKEDLFTLIDTLRRKTGSNAPIIIDEALGTRREIMQLIDSCHAYVSTDVLITAPVSEAVARQKLVLVADSFRDTGEYLLPEAILTIPASATETIQVTPDMLAYLPHHKDVSWPKLAVDDVRHALRRAFAMPNDERRAMGQAAYDYLRADLRPEVLLPQAEELIKSAWAKKVAQEPFLPALVPALKTWLTPETEPVDLPAWLARIESAQAEERWADGVTLAKNALKHGAGHPASAQAGLWNRLGFCHFHLNHRPEAEIAFNRAVELAPTDLAGLTNLAGFYYQQERFDRATEFINRALQVNPQDIDTLMLLGNCALNLGDVDTARLAFGRVQTLAPTTEGIDELVQALAAAEPASDPDPAPEPPTAPAPLRPAPGASAGFSSRPAAGRLPQPLPGPLFLNVGCGKDVRQNFVNIDLFSDDPTVVAMDVRRLDLPDSCADGVLASDILEHFSHREVDAVLAEWARVLKPGGELILRCPSLHLQAKAYLSGVWNADVASYMIFGGQTNPGDYHCIAFDEASIRRHLAAAGLTVTAFEEVDTPQERGFINLNMTVHARKSPVSRPNGAIGVVWEGSQFVTHSLALINREVCLRLAGQAGVDLSVVPFEAHQFGPETDPRFAAIAQNINRLLAGPVDVTVRHQWPPNFAPPPAGHWVMMQPWEFGSLPKNWIEVMRRQVDEVWAYTNYVRDCYIRSGMPAERVHVVPPGVAVDTFRPDAPPLALSTGKRFKFLFVGGTIGRKGIDILLKAYTAAFTAADDVCLVIKDMGGQSFYEGQTAQEMIAKMRQQPNAPEIEYIDAMLDEAQLAGLYTAADCLVHPYRGEGFGLPIAEAMACGLPVIVTGHGAALDFCTADTAYLIPAQEVRLPRKEIGGKETVDFPWWAEPDPAALQQLLRHVFTHPTEARQKAQAGMAFVRSNFTWDRTAHLVQERLQHLRGQPIVRQPAAPDPAALARVQAALAPGQALLEAGQLEEAAAELADVAARMPGEPAAHNLLGLALYRLDRLAEAEAAFQQAAAVAPGQIDAHLLLADLYRTHRAYRQAMAAVRAALEIDGENIEALVSYGLLMLDLDDLEGGEMAWERLVDAPTDHPGVSALLAALVGKGSARVGLAELLTRVEAAQAAEAWPQAAALLKGVLRHGSLAPAEAAGLWNRLGLCHFHQGQFTEAGIALARGLELAPDNLDLLGNMAQLTYQQEQFDRATEFINRALKITPDDVNILSLLGNCAVQLGALDVADMAFRRVKLLAPQTPGVDDVLAQLEALEHEPA